MISAADCSLSCFLDKISNYLSGEEDGDLQLSLYCTKKAPTFFSSFETPFTSLWCDIPKHNN